MNFVDVKGFSKVGWVNLKYIECAITLNELALISGSVKDLDFLLSFGRKAGVAAYNHVLGLVVVAVLLIFKEISNNGVIDCMF